MDYLLFYGRPTRLQPAISLAVARGRAIAIQKIYRMKTYNLIPEK